MLEGILAFILVFAIIVFIHELGHFIFAKRAGILVREFSIGFGPKLFYHRGEETTYTIRLLPLGGYVMMAGYEEEDDLRPGMFIDLLLDVQGKVEKIKKDKQEFTIDSTPLEVTDFDLVDDLYVEGYVDGDTNDLQCFKVKRNATIEFSSQVDLPIAPRDRRFQNATLWDRILTNFAGPLNNFILSILAFMLFAFLIGGAPVNQPIIGSIAEDTPAASSSLQEGDRILSINGQEINSWVDMQVVIQENPGQKLDMQVQGQDGNVEAVTLTPQTHRINEETTVGQIGVGQAQNSSPLAIIAYGFTMTWGVITQVLSVLATIFTGGFTLDNLGGPVAIFAVSERVVQTGGFVALVSFLASLSTNLGLVNLLPIPALDGGKLLLNIVEGVRGKPISEEKEVMITLIGAGFLLILMVAVTWKDIQTFFF